MGKVIPEDVHDRCVEEAERLRKRLELVTAGARRMRCPEHATDASNGWGCPVCVYELRQSRAEWMSAARIHVQTIGLLDDRLIALAAALDGYAMDLAHTEALLIAEHGELEYTQEMLQSADDTAENLQSERDKYRAALRAPDGELWADLVARLMRNYEAALAESAGLRACLDRIEERAAGAAEYRNPPSYGREYAAYWRDVIREARAALAEGQPAGEPTQDAEPAQCRCREHWIGAQGEVCSRGAFPLASYLCLHCGRCRACHAQPAEGGK
jgi:hypothetical protein